MLYLPDLNLCFIHIPKTAGTWVRMALRSTGLRFQDFGKALEHADRHEALGHLPSDVELFTTVRHPFAWLRSFWVDRQLKGWGGDLQIGIHCENQSFELFTRTVCNLLPGYITELYERYTGDLVTADCVLAIQSEPITGSLPLLISQECRARGMSTDMSGMHSLPPMNLGAAYQRFHRETEGHPELWELVRMREPKIYETFGYEVEPPPRVSG